MERITIVTDSTCNIPSTLVEKYDISIIPLTLLWGDESYLDGIDVDADTFYRWLQEREEFPTTSQPSVGVFINFFNDVAERLQTDTILGIFVSSKLSGTLASATQAKAELPNLNIELLDSAYFSMGLGFQVLIAAQAAEEGMAMDAILERVHRTRESMKFVFSVDTLEYLHRGGRIGGAARLLGTMLNLKPLLTIEDGRVEPLEKVRSRQRSLKRMIEIAEQHLAGRTPTALAIMQADTQQEEVDMVAAWVKERLRPAEIYTVALSPVVGTHSGPGTIGIGYYTE